MAELPDILAVWAQLGFSAVTLLVLALLALLFSSYVKIITVLGIVRAGLGVGSLPSAFVAGGLAFALALLVMFPTLQLSAQKMDAVLRARGAATMSDVQRVRVFEAGLGVWSDFLNRHAHEKEKGRFCELAKGLDVNSVESAPSDCSNALQVVAPAFLVSELKEAFATGLSVFLPFLIIDLLIANILLAVGLVQINPVIVSLPFKLLLFVLVDGWTLITTNLVATYIA